MVFEVVKAKPAIRPTQQELYRYCTVTVPAPPIRGARICATYVIGLTI